MQTTDFYPLEELKRQYVLIKENLNRIEDTIGVLEAMDLTKVHILKSQKTIDFYLVDVAGLEKELNVYEKTLPNMVVLSERVRVQEQKDGQDITYHEGRWSFRVQTFKNESVTDLEEMLNLLEKYREITIKVLNGKKEKDLKSDVLELFNQSITRVHKYKKSKAS